MATDQCTPMTWFEVSLKFCNGIILQNVHDETTGKIGDREVAVFDLDWEQHNNLFVKNSRRTNLQGLVGYFQRYKSSNSLTVGTMVALNANSKELSGYKPFGDVKMKLWKLLTLEV
ncbi:hypothetical protein Tco_1062669 [Tanacetum coccineum]